MEQSESWRKREREGSQVFHGVPQNRTTPYQCSLLAERDHTFPSNSYVCFLDAPFSLPSPSSVFLLLSPSVFPSFSLFHSVLPQPSTLPSFTLQFRLVSSLYRVSRGESGHSQAVNKIGLYCLPTVSSCTLSLFTFDLGGRVFSPDSSASSLVGQNVRAVSWEP